MGSSLSNLLDDLTQGIPKIKGKYRHDNKKCEISRTKYNYYNCYLEYTNVKNDLLVCKCSYRNMKLRKTFDEDLKNHFPNTYKIFNLDINKLILLLRKRCLPIKMHGWLGKVIWNIIYWKRRFLQQHQRGRYYSCRLPTRKRSFERIWNRKQSWISRFVCLKS